MKYLKISLFFLFIIAAIVVFKAVTGSAVPPQRHEVNESAVNVELLKVTPSDYVPLLKGFGVVSPAKSWQLVPRVNGRVIYLNPAFKVGAMMKANSLLLRIDHQELDIQKSSIEQSVLSAELNIEQLNVQEKNLQTELKVQQEYVSLLERDLDRQNLLLQQGSVSEKEYELARLSHLSAEAKLQSITSSINLIPVQVKQAKSSIESLKIQLRQIELNISYSEIVLPFDARVVTKSLESDEYIRAGSVLAQFDSTDQAEIFADFPSDDVDSLLMNSVSDDSGYLVEATVSMKSDGKKYSWKAILERTDASIDRETRCKTVILLVDDPYGTGSRDKRPPLVKNAFCDVEIKGPVQKNRIIIPRTAIHEDGVYICENNRLRIVKVEIEHYQDDIAIVSSGITIGDRIIVSRLVAAVSGMLLNEIENKGYAGTKSPNDGIGNNSVEAERQN